MKGVCGRDFMDTENQTRIPATNFARHALFLEGAEGRQLRVALLPQLLHAVLLCVCVLFLWGL